MVYKILNPFSRQPTLEKNSKAAKKFGAMTREHKVITVLATLTVGILTLGLGAYPYFHLLVGRFRKVEISQSPQDLKIRESVSSVLPIKPSAPPSSKTLEAKTIALFSTLTQDKDKHRQMEMLLNCYENHTFDMNEITEILLQDVIPEDDKDRPQLRKILGHNLTHFQPKISEVYDLNVEGGRLAVYSTVGDGTCGLHALLGEINKDNRYACAGPLRREELCQWIEAQPVLPERIENVLTDYFRSFAYAPRSFQMAVRAKYEEFHKDYDKLTFEQKDQRIEAFLQAPEVRQAYYDTLKATSQYLLQDELIAAAECFGKTLVLCQPGWGEASEQVFQDTFNEGASEPVYVYYNGVNHYERASLISDQA